MPETPPRPSAVSFDSYTALLSTQELLRYGTRIRLAPQAFHVLQMLIERPGELVTREEFHRALWPSDTFVDFDQGLNNAIRKIRDALCDSAEAPRYIETLPKLGYRFVGRINGSPKGLYGADEADSIHLVSKTGKEVEPAGAARTLIPVEGEGETPTVVSPIAERRPADRTAIEAGKLMILDRVPSRTRKKLWIAAILAFAAMLVAAVAFRHRFLPAESAAVPLEWTPFTTLPGSENSPTFSPDGEQLAFDYFNGSEWNIFTKRFDDERLVRITDPPDFSSCPSWSPDGKLIAYLKGTMSSGFRLRSGIFLMSPSGGEKRRLLDVSHVSCYVGWSPNSKTIVYGPGWSATEKAGLFLVDLENPAPRRIVTSPAGKVDFAPAFSHDGKKIVFGRATSLAVQDLYVVAASGGQPMRITRLNANLGAPVWTKDDRSVIFWAGSGWTGALYRVGANGGTPEKLPLGTRSVGRMAISADGRQFVYVQPEFDSNIWRVNLTAAKASPEKFIASTWTELSPDISPDDKKIVFLSDRDDTQALWICSADCVNPQKLQIEASSASGAPTRPNLPRWSHDGGQIAFDAVKGEHRQIFVVDAAGGKPLQLTDGEAESQAPNWSSDGQWIYFGSDRNGNWEVWKTSLKTRETRQVTRNGGYFAAESDDGKLLFYQKPADDMATWTYNRPGLYMTPRDGGEERLIVPTANWHWRVTHRGVYYADNDAKPRPVLKLFHPDTEKTETIAALDKEAWGGPGGIAVSSDGAILLYSQIDAEGSDLMLVKNGVW